MTFTVSGWSLLCDRLELAGGWEENTLGGGNTMLLEGTIVKESSVQLLTLDFNTVVFTVKLCSECDAYTCNVYI